MYLDSRKIYLPLCIWKSDYVDTLQENNDRFRSILICYSEDEAAFNAKFVRSTIERPSQLSHEFMVTRIGHSVFIWNNDVKPEHANYTMTFYDGW